MGLQFVRLTKEVVFNTFPVTPDPIVSTDLYLPQDNAMGVRPTPVFWEIRDAGVGNRLVRRKPGRITVGGPFSTYLFPSQTAFLMDLAATLVGTPPCIGLKSFSIDHAIVRDFNCGTDFRRYTGNLFGTLNLKSDMSDAGWLWSVSGNIIGSTPRAITVTDFPIPALSSYPADDPYLYQHTAGNVTIGSVRSNYQSLELNIANEVVPFADENVYASDVRWFGRTVTFTIKIRLKSAADRLTYEAGTTQAASIQIDNSTHSITFDFGSNVITDSVVDELPRNGYFMQTLSFTSMMDASLGTPTDLTITIA
jgi:hypothetical protein